MAENKNIKVIKVQTDGKEVAVIPETLLAGLENYTKEPAPDTKEIEVKVETVPVNVDTPEKKEFNFQDSAWAGFCKNFSMKNECNRTVFCDFNEKDKKCEPVKFLPFDPNACMFSHNNKDKCDEDERCSWVRTNYLNDVIDSTQGSSTTDYSKIIKRIAARKSQNSYSGACLPKYAVSAMGDREKDTPSCAFLGEKPCRSNSSCAWIQSDAFKDTNIDKNVNESIQKRGGVCFQVKSMFDKSN